MRKHFGVIFGFVVLAAGIAVASADTLNLHNGYIAVTNATSGVIHVSIPHQEWGLPAGRTENFNGCCIVAGAKYEVTARLSGHVRFFEATVVPRLCSKHAIPYGYAHLVVHEGGHISRVDTKCP